MANEDKLLQQGYELYKEACKIYDDVEAAGFGIEGNLVTRRRKRNGSQNTRRKHQIKPDNAKA